MKNYIGLDAHLTTCTFVTLNGRGKKVNSLTTKTTEKNLVTYIRSLKGEKFLTLEESNLSKWLYVSLKNEVDKLVVCNPYYLAKKQGPKNDYNDALHLANELRCDHLVSVFHDEANEYIELRALVSGYNDLMAEIVRTKNRYNAVFRTQAIKTSLKSEYKNEERIQSLDSNSKKIVCTELYKILSQLEESKKRYAEQFSLNMKEFKLLKRLATIPGISDVRAHIIAAIICDGARFSNKHRLWSYSMLVKHHCTSDGVLYRKRKSYGRTELKNVFMGAAESILMTNKGSLRAHYDKMRLKGSNHRDAKKSVARKVAAIALMIMKTGKSYDDKYEVKKQRKEKLVSK